MFDEDRVCSSEYKSIKKSGNEIVKILAKLKSWNLPKSKSENLFKSNKVQNTSATQELNFSIYDAKIVFTKLK